MNDFVVIKLITNEMIMAAIVNETSDYVLIENPIGVKVIQVNTSAGIIEKTATTPFCSLSEDKEFNIDKRQIVYMCGLHSSLIPVYLSLVNSFSDEDNSFSDQVQSALQRLNPLFNQAESETEEQVEDDSDELDNVFYIFPDEPKIH